MSKLDLIKKTRNAGNKPKGLRLVALEGSSGESDWRKTLKALIGAPVVGIGLETQELLTGDNSAAGLTVAVLSPKDPFNAGVGSIMKAAMNGEPSKLLVGILDSDGDSRFNNEQEEITRPLAQLIADRNGTFVCNSLDKLAEETNRRFSNDEFVEVSLKTAASVGNFDSAMN